MPAARQRSRSPGIAFAVSATIGARRPFEPASRPRMARVASKPSITGIWQSISTRSKRAFDSAATASAPFTQSVGADAEGLHEPNGDVLIHAVVFDEQHASGRIALRAQNRARRHGARCLAPIREQATALSKSLSRIGRISHSTQSLR